MLKRFLDQVISVTVTALLLTGATTVWQNVTDGELVELFGGVAEATIVEVRNDIKQSIADVKQSIPILDAAVTAFDSRDGCPDGWTPLSIAEGRVVVGAGQGYAYRDRGGEESVSLTERHMPAHVHTISRFEWGHTVNGGDGDRERLDVDNNEPTRAHGELVTDNVGAGEAHPNMPPYVALYFCRKE